MTEQQHPHIQVSGDAYAATIGAARVGSTVPSVYRLVTKDDGNGGIAYAMQAYFTWTEGSRRGGEWRELETQDQTTAEDSIPFGPLF